MLKILFGDNALTKILDFFLENRFWDYTKTDVAREAEVLEELEVVKPSRKIGATVLYKANTESPIFKKLSELALEIASKTHEETIKEEEKVAVPVEA